MRKAIAFSHAMCYNISVGIITDQMNKQSRTVRVKCRHGRGVAGRTKGFYLAVCPPHPAVTIIRSLASFLCSQMKYCLKRRFFILNEHTDNKRKLRASAPKLELSGSIFSRDYWKEARRELANPRTLAFASLIIALRVIVKMTKIPIISGLSLTFDCYVNALGSIVYGPVVAILVGAVSDTLGCIIFPSGPYFFPFIFVEISSSVLFALYFWRRRISVGWVLLAKFTVNTFCNIILTSVFMKWMYVALGDPKATTYNIVNGVRIAKNMVTFPIESILIVAVLGAFIPILKKFKAVPASQNELIVTKKHVIAVAITTLLSVGLILFYVFFLKDFISAHNIKLF